MIVLGAFSSMLYAKTQGRPAVGTAHAPCHVNYDESSTRRLLALVFQADLDC